MKEIEPGIFLITEPGYKKITPAVNIYVIAGSDSLVFDAGYGHRSSVAFFVNEFREIEKTVTSRGESFGVQGIMPSHSHGDHFSGLVAVRRRLKIPIMLTFRMKNKLVSAKAFRDHYWNALGKNRPASPAEWLRQMWHGFIASMRYRLAFGIRFIKKPDIIFPEEGDIHVNGEKWLILYTPGHARDHVCLYNEKRGILLGGDIVLKKITTWLGPPESDLEEYRATLERVLSLPGLRIILPAHGKPVDEPQKRIEEILRWRRERTTHVHEILKDAGPDGVTAKSVVQLLYPGGSWAKIDIARGWVELTLDELERNGNATSAGRNGQRVFISKEK